MDQQGAYDERTRNTAKRRSDEATSDEARSEPVQDTVASMSFFRITLHRSAIGLPQRTRDALAALGLRFRNQTVVHAVSPSAAGLIFQVKELVKVAEVAEGRAETLAKLKAARRPDPGYTIVKKYETRGEEAL